MCLAIPAEVIALLDGDRARVSVGGVTKDISLALVDHVAVGDYVLLGKGSARRDVEIPDINQRVSEVVDIANVHSDCQWNKHSGK